MRDYLPLIFELLLVGAVLIWGVRELLILRREKKKDEEPPDRDLTRRD
ncbi:MAG: hypothetical protein RKE49_12770 [Oceanicaulis sp.]